MIEVGDRVRTQDGRVGVVESRLNGVWSELVDVQVNDGHEAINDRELEVIAVTRTQLENLRAKAAEWRAEAEIHRIEANRLDAQPGREVSAAQYRAESLLYGRLAAELDALLP